MVHPGGLTGTDQAAGPAGDSSGPWSRQTARKPPGVTATVIRCPQAGQNRGGSRARPHPVQTVSGAPHPVQLASTPVTGGTALTPRR